MNRPNRRRTINSKGEIVDIPYGPSRWASPRSYACAHNNCDRPATTLKRADAHRTQDAAGGSSGSFVATMGAHNCCGQH